jgi:enoyl-[acyl-carrier protein] reductase I
MTAQGLMTGKRGLIMGVANDHSIAWGIAQACAAQGAELAFTYQGDAFGKRVKPLAASLGAKLVIPADVEDEQSLEALFGTLEREWGGLDFVVHCIAFADKTELKGRYCDTSRKNFARALDISCFSFTDIARRAAPLMKSGGALITLSYMGAVRVIPNYNVMGVAKAALEASVRYLAADLGPEGIRVNCISAGPMRTLAGSAIGDARLMFRWNKMNAPMKRNIELEHVGNAGLYLLSDLSAGVTGEIHYVDSGYNIVGMPSTADLKLMGLPDENGNGDAKPARTAE